MKKITILKKDYSRKKRFFYEKEHHHVASSDFHEDMLLDKSRNETVHDETEKSSPENQNIDIPINNGAVSEAEVFNGNHEISYEEKYHDVNEKRKLSFNPLWFLVLPLLLLSIVLFLMLMDKKESKPEKSTVKTLSAVQIINNARKDVVSVVNLQKANNLLIDTEVAETPEEVGIGSGVVYKITDKTAYIITNYHVVKDAETIELTTFENEKLIAKVKAKDEWTDIAILTAPKGKLKSAMSFGDSDHIEVGETAIAIGSPLGQSFAGSVSKGIISGLHRNVPVDMDGDGVYDFESQVLQTDAAINPGNSGGALINKDGALIGINSMKIALPNVEGISFAIPSNEVKTIVDTLEKDGRINRPKLGIMVEDINNLFVDAVRKQINLPESIDSGVIITEVEEGSLAESLGLNTKDLIVKLDDQPMNSMLDFRRVLFYEKKIGDPIEISYYRQGTLNTIKGKLK